MFLFNLFPGHDKSKRGKCEQKTNGGAVMTIIHFLLDLIE